MLTLLSVNEIFLPKYMNLSNNFKGLPFNEKMLPSWLKLLIHTRKLLMNHTTQKIVENTNIIFFGVGFFFPDKWLEL